jgi:hypothetical protein
MFSTGTSFERIIFVMIETSSPLSICFINVLFLKTFTNKVVNSVNNFSLVLISSLLLYSSLGMKSKYSKVKSILVISNVSCIISKFLSLSNSIPKILYSSSLTFMYSMIFFLVSELIFGFSPRVSFKLLSNLFTI